MRGARGRVYKVVPKSQASARSWAERIKPTGPEGGCSAVDWIPTAAGQDTVMDIHTARELAAKDFDGMHTASWRLRLWRASPHDSIPAEALRTLLMPNWYNPRMIVKREGVRWRQDKLYTGLFKGMLHKLLLNIRRGGRFHTLGTRASLFVFPNTMESWRARESASSCSCAPSASAS